MRRRSLCPAIFASTPCAIARGWHSRSLGRGWHRGRVVVDDFPVVAVLHIGEAVAGRNRFGFPVLGVGERVVATVDGGVSVDADQLVTELDGGLRQRLEGADEVGFSGRRDPTVSSVTACPTARRLWHKRAAWHRDCSRQRAWPTSALRPRHLPADPRWRFAPKGSTPAGDRRSNDVIASFPPLSSQTFHR